MQVNPHQKDVGDGVRIVQSRWYQGSNDGWGVRKKKTKKVRLNKQKWK